MQDKTVLLSIMSYHKPLKKFMWLIWCGRRSVIQESEGNVSWIVSPALKT
jgi:hypothetical protein